MKDEIHAADDPVLILNKKISGYAGYQDGNDLDESDNQLRRYLEEKLSFVMSQFNAKKDRLISGNEESYREMTGNISQSMTAIAESLQNPCYCSQGKIANKRLTQQQVEKLHDYDGQLMEQLEILEDEITHLPDQFAEHELPDLLAHVYDLIDGFNQSLTEREFVFLGQEDEI